MMVFFAAIHGLVSVEFCRVIVHFAALGRTHPQAYSACRLRCYRRVAARIIVASSPALSRFGRDLKAHAQITFATPGAGTQCRGR